MEGGPYWLTGEEVIEGGARIDCGGPPTAIEEGGGANRCTGDSYMDGGGRTD